MSQSSSGQTFSYQFDSVSSDPLDYPHNYSDASTYQKGLFDSLRQNSFVHHEGHENVFHIIFDKFDDDANNPFVCSPSGCQRQHVVNGTLFFHLNLVTLEAYNNGGGYRLKFDDRLDVVHDGVLSQESTVMPMRQYHHWIRV